MSTLRVLSYNPHLAAQMPRYEDTRKFKFKRMLKSSDALKGLFDSVREYLVPVPTATALQLCSPSDLLLPPSAWMSPES